MLTRTQIEQATPPAKGRIVLWDVKLPGFGCRVFPSGQRSFILRYRLPGSRQKLTATLGTYGLVTLPQARKRAEEILATVKLGGDPQAERRAREAARPMLTARELVQRYVAALKHGTVKTGRSNGRPPVAAYVADTVVHLERFATRYGRQPADAITRNEVVSILDGFSDRPSVHRRMHGAISRMYAWARGAGLVTGKPAEDIVTASAPARERVLSLAELAAIWQAAEQLDPLYRDLIHLMILTGQRRNEVAGTRWGEIDLTRALWTLPAGRTKARRQHAIPLSATAVAMLEARRKAAQRVHADDLVLPTTSRDGRAVAPISGWNWLKRQLDSSLDLQPWRMHDFRRSLVTHLAEQGGDVAVLDSLLNHASSSTRGGIVAVYQKATLIQPMRELIQLWESMLRQAVDPASRKVATSAGRGRRKGR
jgi:integrase